MTIEKNLFFCRINTIEFYNFRNIQQGVIEFPNSKTVDFLEGNPSIIGLYGQNGSGKSSVIMALGMLKNLLSGKRLGNNYLSCVRYGDDRCKLVFSFALYNKLIGDNGDVLGAREDSTCYEVEYEVEIQKSLEEDEIDAISSKHPKETLKIGYEIIKYRMTDHTGCVKITKQTIFDTRDRGLRKKSYIFGSELKEQLFTAFDDDVLQQYREALAISTANSQSFIFSAKTIKLLEKAISSDFEYLEEEYQPASEILASANTLSEFKGRLIDEMSKNDDSRMMMQLSVFLLTPYSLITNLRLFGSSYLHVVDTVTTGLTNINTQLPLLLWGRSESNTLYNFQMSLQMDGPSTVSEKYYDFVKGSLNDVSNVLKKIVPGVSLSFIDLGQQISSNNEESHCFEILSERGGTTIPLRYESDGIRRIVSILSLLIAAYNDASFTIAIDEIDSGIFEYLLGELLLVMSESIKGQLIFTSHNLRPLEVIPSKYLCFTTTNPEKRFIKLASRGNSNLRDTYFRNIVLNSYKDGIYNPTDKYEIELAFYMAGHKEGQHE